MHIQFVHWRAGEQIVKSFYAFDHFPDQFFLGDFLHRVGDEVQIGVVGDVELNLVPDVRKKRPLIIVNEFVEHFFIRKLDQPAAGMIGGEILAAELPQRGVEVANVDNIPRGVAYFDAVAHTKRLSNQNVNPSDEAFHRRLHSQPDNYRTEADAETGRTRRGTSHSQNR